MAKKKVETKSLTLKFPTEEFDSIIDSYAEKTGWTKKIKLPKKQGKVKQVENPLIKEQHVIKILEERLLSLNK